MKTVIISPFSKLLRNNERNPKNYPFWKDVVGLLKEKGIHIIQIGVLGEEQIGAHEVKLNLKLKELETLLDKSDTFVSVDNFFNHFASYYGKKGVVIFSRSDPNIFGYSQNINLLKDRKHLRSNQFELWEQDSFNLDAFIDPISVVQAIESLL